MLALILGVICIVAIIIVRFSKDDDINNTCGIIALITVIGVFVCLLVSTAMPYEYTTEREKVSATSIVPISENEFIVEGSDGYSYAISTVTNDGNIGKDIIFVSENECTIIPEENCTNPRVETYERKSKVSLWHLFTDTKEEYVIYIPAQTENE